MPDLATEVDDLDGTYGGVTVQFGSGAFSQPAVSSTASSLTIPIHATRTVNQPLEFTFGSASTWPAAASASTSCSTRR